MVALPIKPLDTHCGERTSVIHPGLEAAAALRVRRFRSQHPRSSFSAPSLACYRFGDAKQEAVEIPPRSTMTGAFS